VDTTTGSPDFHQLLGESSITMLFFKKAVNGVSVTGLHLAHAYTKLPWGVKALAIADLIVGNTFLIEPTISQGARIIPDLTPYGVRQALQIVDDPARREMVEQGFPLHSVAPAPTVSIGDMIAKASDAELACAFAAHMERLWRIFDHVTAVDVAA
jgi:hypothetical protein